MQFWAFKSTSLSPTSRSASAEGAATTLWLFCFLTLRGEIVLF
jgi:hypothetical protein